MKKITLLLFLLITSLGFSQTISNPVYDGPFGGAVYNQTFTFPTGAEAWAGFANNNTSIYPLSFPNAGKIRFKATVSADAEVYFRFEANPHPDVDPSQNTANVTLLASNDPNTEYEIDIPGNATNTYNSAIMYVVTRDVDVNISEIKIDKFDADGTTVLKTDFPVYDGPFGNAVYDQKFTFPADAETWGGFANNNTSIYPMSFPEGGKVKFKATVSADAEVYFRFEANAHPNVDPSQNTANVKLLASNAANTEYEIDVPGNATNTYNSAIMYVVTRDVEVSISEIKISQNASNGNTGGATGEYCEKVVTHLGIASGQEASAIKLTIENSGENSMKVTIESNDADPVDFLLIPGGVTGSPTISESDTSVSGKISATLTWAETPPAEVALNILWSKESTEGNWQLVDSAVTVNFNATCATASVNDNQLLSITMYPNPVSNRLNISSTSLIRNAGIYNIMGKQVMRVNINKNSQSFNVSNLASGIYFIRYNVDGKVGTSKFIKQ